MINYLTYNIKEHNTVWFKVPFTDDGSSFWSKLYVDLKEWVKYLLHFNYHFEAIPPLKEVVFLITTDNQNRALEPIYSKMDSAIYSIIDTRQKNPFYPKKKWLNYSMLFVANLIITYCFSTREDKRRIAKKYKQIMPTIGVMKCTKDIFAHCSNVKLVVLANDHSAIHRSIIKLAPLYGIKTLYTQHCSIASHFPSLQFSYSFLDGEETFEKYKSIGDMRGTIYISGNPRFDKIAEYKSHKKPSEVVGIAINLLDDEAMVKCLCEQLLKDGYKLCVRPHPRQTLSYYDWYVENGIEISDSKTETPFEFAARVRVIIAGETGLHFDAAMMGVNSICYIFDGKPVIDWYSYIQNGLISYAKNIHDLSELLHQRMQHQCKENNNILRWYNAAYMTGQEGHIGEQIRDFIICVLQDRILDFDAKYGYQAINTQTSYTKMVYL